MHSLNPCRNEWLPGWTLIASGFELFRAQQWQQGRIVPRGGVGTGTKQVRQPEKNSQRLMKELARYMELYKLIILYIMILALATFWWASSFWRTEPPWCIYRCVARVLVEMISLGKIHLRVVTDTLLWCSQHGYSCDPKESSQMWNGVLVTTRNFLQVLDKT